MANAVTISQKTISEILKKLDSLTQDVKSIKERLIDEEPPYGSDEWWEWSDARSLKSIKEGKGTVIRNKKELSEFFHNLKEKSKRPI